MFPWHFLMQKQVFFLHINYFLSQKQVSVTETCFCQTHTKKKQVSVTETIFFCNRNKFLLMKQVSAKETSFGHIKRMFLEQYKQKDSERSRK